MSNSNNNLFAASQQWATRPDDQRYLSLDELAAAVGRRRKESWTATPTTNQLRIVPTESNGVLAEVYDPTAGQRRQLAPTHFAFGQLSSYASAPAGYLRKLPSELAAINLQWGLEHSPIRDNTLVLGQSNGDNILRAMTSTSYGRIWDSDVVKAVQNANMHGRWKIPSASYATTNPRRATTLYASDRDVFIFLVDDENPIEVDGDKLFRGFYVWNSEVGSATFGLTTFLYRYVCDNRIIWGATDVKELRIRHTGGAPERFAYEGEKFLAQYAKESTQHIADTIKRAADTEIPLKQEQTVANWLQSRGFTAAISKASVQTAEAEEGSARTLWQIVNGITAHARSIPNSDDRVALEQKAGKLLELAEK